MRVEGASLKGNRDVDETVDSLTSKDRLGVYTHLVIFFVRRFWAIKLAADAVTTVLRVDQVGGGECRGHVGERRLGEGGFMSYLRFNGWLNQFG